MLLLLAQVFLVNVALNMRYCQVYRVSRYLCYMCYKTMIFRNLEVATHFSDDVG